MALGSTQPLTEMSTRNLPGGKGLPARKADSLTAICEPRLLTTLWALMACYRDSFTFTVKDILTAWGQANTRAGTVSWMDGGL
jgi:hypothetical protein